MKKWIILIMCLMLTMVTLLSSCGNLDEYIDEENQTTEEETDYYDFLKEEEPATLEPTAEKEEGYSWLESAFMHLKTKQHWDEVNVTLRAYGLNHKSTQYGDGSFDYYVVDPEGSDSVTIEFNKDGDLKKAQYIMRSNGWQIWLWETGKIGVCIGITNNEENRTFDEGEFKEAFEYAKSLPSSY